MNRNSVDKILNNLEGGTSFKPTNNNNNSNNQFQRLRMNEYAKPNEPNFQTQTQVQPNWEMKQSQTQVTRKEEYVEPIKTEKPKVFANGQTAEEFDKTLEKHFGGGLDDELNEINNGIKIKKNVNSILAEINKRTFIQTMSKDKTQFSKTFNIKVVGIGGAGNNIVKYMKTSQEWPDFVQIIALNTDYVALSAMGDLADIFILGAKELDGNGSGGDPNVGKAAAEADAEIIKDMLKGTDVLILTAGLGKGTGTGATPIIAKIAQDLGILTIGLFNLPSIGAEGNKTYSNALSGLQKLSYLCNGLTTVNNDKIISLDRERMSIKKAFEGANQYIKTIVEEIINIITKPSDINIDFADVRNFFEDKNGFLFMRVDITDYSKDAIKESIENAIKIGFSEININESQKALINFRLNENVPSLILENSRSALKELVNANNINIVHGISFNDIHENAQINILLTGSFELGAIEDDESVINNTMSDKPDSITSELDLNKSESQNEDFLSNNFGSPYGNINPNNNSSFNQNRNVDFSNFYNKSKSNSYSFEYEDDESIDSQKYDNRNHLFNNNNHMPSYGNRDYRDDRMIQPKPKKQGFFSRFFKRSREEY